MSATGSRDDAERTPGGAGVSSWRAATALTLYLVVAVVQTAPLALHLTTSIPFGNDTAATVPRLNVWALWWNDNRLFNTGYRGYWDAPIFYPEPESFAYTETEWLTGLVASPVFWISRNAALTYDVVLLAALVLAGVGAFSLLRAVGLGFPSALAGGLIAEMMPTVADQLGVLQSATALFPVLIALTCAVRFGRTGSVSSALGLGLSFAACFHTSSNTALFLGPPLLLGVLILGGRRLLRVRALVSLAAGAALAVALIAPIAIVQMRVLGTMPPHAAIAGSSAHLGAFGQMAPTNVLRRRPPDRKELTLGLGIALPALAVLGLWAGLRRRDFRRWAIYCTLTFLLCTLLSFGPTLGSIPGLPYDVLRACYPGFRYARNLWRFSALGQVFLVGLAALALDACFASRGRRRGALLGTLATLAVGIDLLATPVPLLDLRSDCRGVEWVQALMKLPPQSTIVHIPMPTGVTADDYERTAAWMVCQMYHGLRMANGYGAYVPGRTALLLEVMPGFPDAESLRTLRYFGIDHVVAARDWMTPENGDRAAQWRESVIPEVVTTDATIYRIAGAVPH